MYPLVTGRGKHGPVLPERTSDRDRRPDTDAKLFK